MNFIPIVDMKNYPSLHNEIKVIKKTKNSWEYYFEKLNKYSLNEVYKSKMFTWVQNISKNMSIDMTSKQISKYFKKIKIRKEILQKINNFDQKNLEKW